MAQTVGVIGDFDTKKFNDGLNIYINGLLRAQTATQNAVARLNAIISTVKPIQPIKLNALIQGSTNAGNISALVTQLNRLSKVGSIPQATIDSINHVATALGNLTTIPNLGNVSKNLSSVVKAVTGLSNLQGINSSIVNTISGFATGLSTLSNLPNLNNVTNNIKRLVAALQTLGTVPAPQGSVFQTISGMVNILGRLNALPNAGANVQSIGQLLTALNRLGKIQPIPPAVLQSIQSLLSIIQKAASGNLGALSTILGFLTKFTTQASSYTASAIQAGQATDSFFSSLTRGVGIGIGAGAIQLFISMKNAIAGLISQSYNAIQFFEGFRLSLQSVVASQIRSADSTKTFAEALELGKDKAFAFEQILTDLAIKSKFTTQQVAAAFQTAIAQSFDPEQALRVTKALVDFSSGKGLSAEKLDLIALALGQINSKGKLASQEINQLAQQGVPVRNILADAFGVTLPKLEKMISDGLIPASDALEAIIGMMERDFAGAAERTQNTLSGLISSLADIKERSQAMFFEKVFQPAIPVLQELVATLTTPEFTATLQVLAELIGVQLANAVVYLRDTITGLIQSFLALSPETKRFIFTFIAIGAAITATYAIIGGLSLLLGALINPFTVIVSTIALVTTAWINGFQGIYNVTVSVAGNIATVINGLLSEVVSWGSNIVNSLADGIIGAVDSIVSALSVVGSAIQYLLEPGSPPRLLPDLDKWGTGAAQAYLDGWTMVQFDTLDRFGQLIEKRIQQAVQLGSIAKGDSFNFEIIAKQQIAEAIAQLRSVGSVAQETIDEIARVSAFPAEVIQNLVDKFGAVAISTDAVNSAQEALNAATKKYDDLLAPIEARLGAINRQTNREENEKKLVRLRRIAASQLISEERRRQAQLEIEKLTLENQASVIQDQKDSEVGLLQSRLDAAKTAQDAAQKELDLYLAKLNVQNQTVDIMAQQLEYMRQLISAVSSIGDKVKEGLSPLEQQLKKIQLQQDELQDIIELKRQEAILNDDNATAAQKYAAQLKIQEIQIRRNMRALDAKELGLDLTPISNIPITMKDIEKGSKKAGDEIEGFGKKMKGITGLDIDGKLKEFEQTIDNVRSRFKEMGNQFSATIDQIDAKMPSFLKIKADVNGTIPAINSLKIAFIGFGAYMVGSKIIGSLPVLQAVLQGIAWVGRTLVLPVLEAIVGFLGAPLTIALGVAAVAIGGFYFAWTNNWFGIRDKTMPIIDNLRQKLDKFQESPFFTQLKDKFTDVKNHISDFFVNTDWLGMLSNAVTTLGGIWDLIKQRVVDGWNNFSTYWDSLGSDWLTRSIRLLGVVIGGIARFLWGTALPMLVQAIASVISYILGTLPTQLQNITNTVIDFIFNSTLLIGQTIFLNWIPAFVGWVTEAIPQLFTNLADMGNQIRSYVKTELLPALQDAGGSIWSGMRDGFTTGITDSWQIIVDAFNKVVAGFKEFWGIASPSKKMYDEIGSPMGLGFINGVAQAIRDGVASVLQSFTDLINGVFSEETYTTIKDKALSIGNAIVDGIKSAFTSSVDATGNAFRSLIDGIFGAGQDEAEIHSPSERAKRDIGAQITAGIGEGLTIGSILETIGSFVSTILTSFVSLTTGVLATMAGFSLTLFTTFTTISTTATTLITTMVDTLLATFLYLQTTCEATVTLLSTDLQTIFINLESAVELIVTTLVENILSALTRMKTSAEAILNQFKSLVLQKLNELLTAIRTDFVAKGENVGEDFIRGMIKGIQNEISDLKKAAEDAVNAAIAAAKKAADSHSPSKRSEKEVGAPFVTGITVGMLSKLNELKRTAETVTRGMFASTQNYMSGRLGTGNSSTVNTSTTNNNWNLTLNTGQSSGSVVHDFTIMQVMAGA